MALEQIVFNIASFNDADAGGNNYYAGAIYEIYNLNDTLADIFSDAAGVSPIAQDGINNVSDSTGKALFYIEKGGYYGLVSGERRDINTSINSTDIINNLSLPYVFDTVVDYKAFSTAFPVGKIIRLLDRDAEFTVISGTGSANTYDTLSSDVFSQSIALNVSNSTVTTKSLGSIADNTTDILPLLQFSVDKYKSTVVNTGAYYCSGMVGIPKDAGVYLSYGTTITKWAAFTTNSEPVFWLKGDNAILIGASMTGSLVQSERNALDGVVLIGHRDMTASHANVNYCTLDGLRIAGAIPFGQTDTSTDKCLVVQNPQFNGFSSYFHNINNIVLANSNVGFEFRGWANAITGGNIHGFRLGNPTAGVRGFIWLNGALDNAMSNFFFHQSPDSHGCLITELDNTANGGINHIPQTNSFKGLVFEQGGSLATGLNSSTESGLSYFEVVANVSGGNVSTEPTFFTENIIVGNKTIQCKSTSVLNSFVENKITKESTDIIAPLNTNPSDVERAYYVSALAENTAYKIIDIEFNNDNRSVTVEVTHSTRINGFNGSGGGKVIYSIIDFGGVVTGSVVSNFRSGGSIPLNIAVTGKKATIAMKTPTNGTATTGHQLACSIRVIGEAGSIYTETLYDTAVTTTGTAAPENTSPV